jgi:hypothetical protein
MRFGNPERARRTAGQTRAARREPGLLQDIGSVCPCFVRARTPALESQPTAARWRSSDEGMRRLAVEVDARTKTASCAQSPRQMPRSRAVWTVSESSGTVFIVAIASSIGTGTMCGGS